MMFKPVLACFYLLIFSSALQAGEKLEAGKRYAEPTMGFSVLLPHGWKLAIRTDLGFTARMATGPLKDGFAPTILFQPKLDVNALTLEKYAEQWQREMAGYSLESRESLSSQSGAVVKLVMTPQEAPALRRIFYLFEAGAGRTFSMTCTVHAKKFAEFEPVFDVCMQGFLLDRPADAPPIIVPPVTAPVASAAVVPNDYTIELPEGVKVLDRVLTGEVLGGTVDGMDFSLFISVDPAKGTLDDYASETLARMPELVKVEQRAFDTRSGIKGIRVTLNDPKDARLAVFYCFDGTKTGKRYKMLGAVPQPKLADVFDAIAKSLVIGK